jgi:uncharacterized DUF497 family protein
VQFEWDPDKDQANQRKHGLSFSEAAELFRNGNDFLEIYDEEHSDEEDRFIAIGPIGAGVAVVVYTVRSDDIMRETGNQGRNPTSTKVSGEQPCLTRSAS